MKKRIGISFMLLGAACVIVAGMWLFFNLREDKMAGIAAESVIEKIESAEATAVNDEDMPVFVIGDYRYIGYIQIPSINVEAPIMDDWDYSRLKLATCRYYGSYKKKNLVIAAHNYNHHFGRLKYVGIGDPVIIVDANKEKHLYTVAEIELLQPTDIDKMVDNGYDLTLFTCTPGGASRVTVRCKQVDL